MRCELAVAVDPTIFRLPPLISLRVATLPILSCHVITLAEVAGCDWLARDALQAGPQMYCPGRRLVSGWPTLLCHVIHVADVAPFDWLRQGCCLLAQQIAAAMLEAHQLAQCISCHTWNRDGSSECGKRGLRARGADMHSLNSLSKHSICLPFKHKAL